MLLRFSLLSRLTGQASSSHPIRQLQSRIPAYSNKMSYTSYTADKASPFTNAVIQAMRKLYPEELADKSFDNTGCTLVRECYVVDFSFINAVFSLSLSSATRGAV